MRLSILRTYTKFQNNPNNGLKVIEPLNKWSDEKFNFSNALLHKLALHKLWTILNSSTIVLLICMSLLTYF